MTEQHKEDSSSLSVVYYTPADGPVILMVSGSETSIRAFRDIICELANGNQSEILLHDQEFVTLSGLSSLILKVDDKKSTVEQALWLKDRKNPGGPQAVWVKSCEGWDITSEFIDTLIESGSGHQYLTGPPTDDAEIELSFNEPGVG